MENAPDASLKDAITIPLVAVRPLSGLTAGNADYIEDFRLTRQLIADSASKFPEVQQHIQRASIADLNDLSIQEIRDVVLESGYAANYLYNETETRQAWTNTEVVQSRFANDPLGQFYDATTITNLLAAGVMDVDNTSTIRFEGVDLEVASFSENYNTSLVSLYKRLPLVEQQVAPDIIVSFEDLTRDVRQYDAIERSLLVNVGEISFGRPTVYTVDEKELVIPHSLTADFDVYWVDLPVTFRSARQGQVREIGIYFALPDGSVALKLIPAHVSTEFAVSEEYSSPEIGVKAGPSAVSVGEFFKRTVMYKFLRPTIVSFGLGERRFSWLIEHEAARSGSHSFFAIIGVPRNSRSIEFAVSGHVRIEKGIISEILGDVDIAGTMPKLVEVTLQ